MSEMFQCGDNTALVGYLYDECEPAERAAIAAHVAVCAACTAELAALESTRIQLVSWTPPETELGFVISRPQASGPRPQGWARSEALDSPGARGLRRGPWLSRPLPGWAQVAAAGVIFATGLLLGVARGTARTAAPVTSAAAPIAAASTEAGSTDALAALEGRLREEIAELRTAAAPDALSRPSAAESQLIARVRALIDESEQRQRRELALRTAEIVRDFDSQRRVDLAQIQRSFGQIEGLTGAEVREQRQLLNYLMRVSQQR